MNRKLSIVIPVYNAEKYIEECLTSILSEMDDEIELLLLDDGSKDFSYEIIQKYEKSNIRIFHHENNGVSYTRNCGIMEAVGEYIMFVDADDRLSPGWKSAVLSGCDGAADVVYYNKNFDEQRSVDKTNIIHGIFGIFDSKCNANMSSPWSKLYRREFLLHNQIRFDCSLINGEDGIFNLNAILRAEHFACRKVSYYQYRIYMGSSSKKYSDKFYDSNLRYFSLAENILKDGQLADNEIHRCLSYAVTYSVYLYLSLVSTVPEENTREKALQRIKDVRLQEYIKKYGRSTDCSKAVQWIYWFAQHGLVSAAEELIILKNAVKKRKKTEMKWVTI